MTEKETDICRIMMKDVRLSYPVLFKAKPFGNDANSEPAFSAEFLVPKDTSLGKKIIDQVEDAIEEAKYKKWGDDPKKWPRISKDKPFFKDGDDRDYERPETRDHMIVAARNLKAPRVLGIDKEDLRESDGVIYAGCYVDAIVRVWAQDNGFGKRVNCSLEAVRFRRDGDPFGAAPVNADEFDDIEDDGRGSRRGRTIEGTARRVGRDDDDDRGSSRRPALEDRRGSRDDDEDTGSRRRGRDSDEDDKPRRGRDDDDDRGSRRSRDDDEDRGTRRSRDDDDDRGSSRGRDRDEERDDDRGSRGGRDRDDDRGSERGRSRERDDDRGGSSRRSSREDDEDRPSRNSRSGGGRRRDEDNDI